MKYHGSGRVKRRSTLEELTRDESVQETGVKSDLVAETVDAVESEAERAEGPKESPVNEGAFDAWLAMDDQPGLDGEEAGEVGRGYLIGEKQVEESRDGTGVEGSRETSASKDGTKPADLLSFLRDLKPEKALVDRRLYKKSLSPSTLDGLSRVRESPKGMLFSLYSQKGVELGLAPPKIDVVQGPMNTWRATVSVGPVTASSLYLTSQFLAEEEASRKVLEKLEVGPH